MTALISLACRIGYRVLNTAMLILVLVDFPLLLVANSAQDDLDWRE